MDRLRPRVFAYGPCTRANDPARCLLRYRLWPPHGACGRGRHECRRCTCLTAALFGVGAILKASATAFALLKLAGAAYLIFLGLRLWHPRHVLPGQVPPAPRSLSRVFLHAWLTTVFNPKSILFFVVSVPQFIDARAPLPPQFATMLATVLICGAIIDGTYSTFAVNVRRLVRTPRLQRAVNRTTGGLLVGEGILAAFRRSLAV